MELDDMKILWDDMHQKPAKQTGFAHHNISDLIQLKFNKKANNFKVAEIIGFFAAYTFAGIILFKFNMLDKWYLVICGVILVIYLLLMPLYTIAGIKRLKKIDLANSSYKEVMEHFYTVKSRLKQSEKISLMASPFLFVASIAIFTKIFTGKDFFSMTFQLPLVILIFLSLLGAILFNIRAFKKREKQLQSVNRLLEEGN
jgi:uncharacterized integral membrane protein